MESLQTHHAADLDELLAVLANQHCRRVLAALRDGPESVTSLEALANHRRASSPDGATTSATRLRHLTLPRLADAGLLEYDTRTRTVRYAHGPSVESLLDTVDSAGR